MSELLSQERLEELRRWFDHSPLMDMQSVFVHVDVQAARIAELEEKAERLERGLPAVYVQSIPYAAAIARLCDDYLDRSGGLLGKVREQAGALAALEARDE